MYGAHLWLDGCQELAELDNVVHAVQEPGIDAGKLVQGVNCVSFGQCTSNCKYSLVSGVEQFLGVKKY